MKAAYSLSKLWVTTRADLGKVTQPILDLPQRRRPRRRARQLARCCGRGRSSDVREVILEDSYHVATLDNDAPTIFEGSVEFVRRLARASA